MARPDVGRVLRPSLIDRFSKRPDREESAFFEGIGIRDLKAEVARDLEWLLNTRMWLPPEAKDLEGLDEARQSLVTYGIPDLSTFSWANPQDRKKIARLVETAIRTFEPRLLSRSIRCEILPSEEVSDFSLKLRIDAVLHVDPISEHVSFDSAADFEGGGISVESFE